MFRRPKGTRDFLPEDMKFRRHIEKTIRKVFESYSYEEILTPTFEYFDLIAEKSGEEIRRSVYVFEDKGGRTLALRPEMTAPIARVIANELRSRPKPLRLYYITNVFRYEEPQRGRWREFWHAGVELVGSSRVESDVEVISLGCEVLETLGFKYYVKLGDVSEIRNVLSEIGVTDEREQNLILSMIDRGGDYSSYLESKGFDPRALNELFSTREVNTEKIRQVLNLMEDKFSDKVIVDLKLSRGLDYYTGLVFEFYVEGLDVAVGGGGRYDKLIETFGGPRLPAVGLAFGLDRIELAAKERNLISESEVMKAIVIPLSEKCVKKSFEISSALRELGIITELEVMGRKLNKSLSYASEKGIRFALILGEKELESNTITVKDLKKGEQEEIELGKLKKYFKSITRDTVCTSL